MLWTSQKSKTQLDYFSIEIWYERLFLHFSIFLGEIWENPPLQISKYEWFKWIFLSFLQKIHIIENWYFFFSLCIYMQIKLYFILNDVLTTDILTVAQPLLVYHTLDLLYLVSILSVFPITHAKSFWVLYTSWLTSLLSSQGWFGTQYYDGSGLGR